MTKIKFILLAFTVSLVALPKARTVKIVDGDTFDCVLAGDSLKTRIRLWCVDTPERGQAGFYEAKYRLGQLLERDSISLKLFGKDRFGRTLAEVYVSDTNVNQLLITEKLAVRWHGCRDSMYFE